MDAQPQLATSSDLAELVEALVKERFDVEALAQLIEHLHYSSELSGKLQRGFDEVKRGTSKNKATLESACNEIRGLIMDVALLKRALASLGHVGVLGRRKIERELVLELFPPTQPRPGAGITVNVSQPKPPQKVDCESRLHLCKAACCRIFNVHLSPQEVIEDRFDWEPRQPYALRKTGAGCSYLSSGGCACRIYEARPNVCRSYSCVADKRIWRDFEKGVINPELEKRLAALDVITAPLSASEDRHGASSSSAQCSAPPATEVSSAPVVEDAHNGAVPQMSDITVPAAAAASKAAPPNFDELRRLIVREPERRFVPPESATQGQRNGRHVESRGDDGSTVPPPDDVSG